jgi:hypothetical protein
MYKMSTWKILSRWRDDLSPMPIRHYSRTQSKRLYRRSILQLNRAYPLLLSSILLYSIHLFLLCSYLLLSSVFSSVYRGHYSLEPRQTKQLILFYNLIHKHPYLTCSSAADPGYCTSDVLSTHYTYLSSYLRYFMEVLSRFRKPSTFWYLLRFTAVSYTFWY